MIRNLTLVLSLVVVCVISVVFFVGLSLSVPPEEDRFYVDLKASPAYVKDGFESAYVSFTSPDITSWDVELPANYDGALATPDLPLDESSYDDSWYPWRDLPTNEFTIMIPFDLTDEQIGTLFNRDGSTAPGGYLSGIGDNWEVFINGEPVYSKIAMDKNGVLTEHFAQRGVFFPINKSVLHSGSNIMVFHIYGAAYSPNTGLFYVQPYYLGDYSAIMSRTLDYQSLAFCTAFIFLGLYHALLYVLRRRDSYNLIYGGFSSMVAVYFFSRSPAIYQVISDTGITQSIEYASLFLVLFGLAAFLEILNFDKINKPTIAYSIFAVLLIVGLFVFSTDFAQHLLAIWQVVATVFMAYVVGYDVIYTLIKQAKQTQKRLDEEQAHGLVGGAHGAQVAHGKSIGFLRVLMLNLRDTIMGNICLFMILVMATGIYDVLDATFLHYNLFLTRYSFFILTLCMAFTLARNYATSFAATAQMNEILDKTVRQRTGELEEQVLIAQAASRAKGDFLSNMSHEIRTPLNAVIGMTSIGTNADDRERKDYAFYRIKEASEHLLGVINDILDMSKIEAGKLDLSEVAFNFRKIVERVSDVIQFKTDEKHQVFEQFVHEDVPVSVFGDDLRLAQVITNLLGNAVKFTPEGGSIHLSAELDSTDGEYCTVRVLVKDSGIGISDEQKSKLFQTFQQAESSTTRSYGGTGLGLALSKQIVELMNGEIWVDSVVGEGSTFGFTVRMQIAKDSDVKSEADSHDAQLVEGEFAGYTILMAEDVDVNREIVHALLEESGVAIFDAVNGLEAVNMFEAEPETYHLILMDVQMPVMDGYDATRRIRAGTSPQAQTIPIVAMTANVFREDVEQALAVGMNTHLGKPINLKELVGWLRKYLK